MVKRLLGEKIKKVKRKIGWECYKCEIVWKIANEESKKKKMKRMFKMW